VNSFDCRADLNKIASANKESKVLDAASEESTISAPPDEDFLDESEDADWYIGKARDDHIKRKRAAEGRNIGEEDPIEWARERRNAENERDSDFGPEDYFEGAVRGGRRGEDEDDDFGETMLLVSLCLTVSLLIYLRGRWIERRRREEEQRRGPVAAGVAPAPLRQNGGLFPARGDPARDEWAVLR